MNPRSENRGHHISQQFNVELEDIKNHMLEMGGVIEKQLADALVSVTSADSGLANKVLVEEDNIDAMEVKIDEECNLILARRQPAASDLRLVLAIIKTVRDLERIGDESAKIARMAIKLAEEGDFPEGIIEFRHLGDRVARMVNRALDAFARYDASAAVEIAKDDLIVDNEYGSAMRSLITYMMEDPRSISRMLNLLWALRALERIGDHAKNVSEHVIYLVKGMDVRHEPLENIADRLAGSE
jgi:phosphate transport system protein